MNIELIVYGEPVGKARPRVTRQGHAYTPQKTRDAEKAIENAYRRKYGAYQQTAGTPLLLNVQTYMKVPKSDSQQTRHKKLSGEIRPTKKPDGDNILKLVADALNGVAYPDDKQLVEQRISKHYSLTPHTKIIITDLTK